MKYLSRLAVVVAALLMGYLLMRRLSDPDLWWHLASARAMVESKTFLRSDIFSYTLHGVRWINFEWASALFLYGIFRFFGLTGLVMWKVVFGLLSVGLLSRLLWREGARGGFCFFLTIFGFLVLKPRLTERPELFSLVFFPAALLLLRASLSSRTKLVLWAALMMVWANTHGGFLFGLILPVLLGLGIFWSEGSFKNARFTVQALWVGFLATCINPFGVRLYEIFFVHASAFQKAPAGVLEEWRSSSVAEGPFFWALFVIVVAALGFLFLDMRQRDGERPRAAVALSYQRNAIVWVPAVFVFALWGSLYTRNMALFAFVALPFLAAAAAPFLAWAQGISWRPTRWLFAAFWLGGFSLFLFYRPVLGRGWPSPLVAPGAFPAAALHFVDDHKIDGTLYNTYHYGGYIEWASGGKRPVFWDGRYLFHVFLKDAVQITAALFKNPPENSWPVYFERYGIDYAIVEPLDVLLPAGLGRSAPPASLYERMFPIDSWALVFWDDGGFVFLKRLPKFAEVIKREEYTVLRPYNEALTSAIMADNPKAKETALAELNRNSRSAPVSFLRARIEALVEVK